MTEIKTWTERCEEHPAHQSGIVTHQMIQDRMQEEIDELRALPKYKRVDLDEMKVALRSYVVGGTVTKNRDAIAYNRAIDEIKYKYGDLYVLTKEGEENV